MLISRFLIVTVVACGSPEAPAAPTTRTAPVTDVTDAGDEPDVTPSLPEAGVSAELDPFAGLTDLLTSPDRVEAFALSTTDFVDGPPSSPGRVDGYRIVSTLPAPSKRFTTELASVLLAPPDHFRSAKDAVECSLAHGQVGLRFTRGADVVELSVLASCPGVGIRTSAGNHHDVQLKPDLLGPLVVLMRATYPHTFR
jgi:hypothetical protein